jgi:hypothetical protein
VRSEDMLETEAHHDLLNFSEELCNNEEKRKFVQGYHAAVRQVLIRQLSKTLTVLKTRGFLNLGCTDDILSSLLDSPDPKSDREKTRAAILDLMVAIGAQSCPNDPEYLRTERFYFARGQQRTFENFLEDPSMNLVRVFLLMSFYMLGACRRNAAFMYLGVASRAAVALGLHEENSGSTSREDSNERQAFLNHLNFLTDQRQTTTVDESLCPRPISQFDTWKTISHLTPFTRKSGTQLDRYAID